MNTDHPKILCIDDNRDIVLNIVELLTKEGFLVYSASDPGIGIAIAKKLDPDLILLGVMMPVMNGYEVCKALQQDEQTSKIPVVFISGLNQPQNKLSGLAAGGADYLTKPFSGESLVGITKYYAGKKKSWSAYPPPQEPRSLSAVEEKKHCNFIDFKLSVIDSFKLDSAGAKSVTALQPGDVYKLAGILKITPARVARLIAGFSKCRCLQIINPDDIKPGALPVKFAVQNNIAAINAPGGVTLLAISHPFNFELNVITRGIMGAEFEFGVTEPSNISILSKLTEEYAPTIQKIPGTGVMVIEEIALNRLKTAAKSVKNEVNEPRVKYLTGKLLQFLAEEKTVEMRIEEKGACYLVSAGAANALEEFTRFSRMTGNMVAARLKALGGMDVVERRKPQKGSFSILCRLENFRLALSTETTEYGESLLLTPVS